MTYILKSLNQRYLVISVAKMAGKFNVKFYPFNSEMDSVSFEESLDPYSAFRKASEDSTVPDQPLWGILVWQVVGIFLLGFIFVCELLFFLIRVTVIIPRQIRCHIAIFR